MTSSETREKGSVMGLGRACLTEFRVWILLYRLFGPMGPLCRLLGQFPVHATYSKDTLLLSYSSFSLATVYSILISFSPLAVIVHGIFNHRSSYMFLLDNVTISAYTVIITTLFGWPSLFKLLGFFDKFDEQFHTLPLITERNKMSKGLIWIAPTMAFFLINLMLVILNTGLSYSHYHFILSMIYNLLVIQISLFIMIIKELVVRVLWLQSSWLQCVQISVSRDLAQGNQKFDQYRSFLTLILRCVSALNQAFTYQFYTICALIFYIIFFTTYTEYFKIISLGNFLQILCVSILIFFIGHYSTSLQLKNRLVLEHIFDLRLYGVNENLRLQVDLLIHQLNRNQLIVYIPGLVTFSTNFVGSFTTVLVTFYILAAQLAIQFKG